MNDNKHYLRLAILAGLAGSALMGMQTAGASGFALAEQNTSGLGNSYAGAAAVAEDASTLFFNSAGLTQLKRVSLVMNGSLIDVKSKFHSSGSQPALGQTLGSEGGNAGGMVLVPATYVAAPLTERISGGVGVNAPFGLATEYDDDFMGRFQGLLSDVKTTNINTALAFKLNNVVSLGIGANYQSLDASLTKNVNFTGVIAQQLQPRTLLATTDPLYISPAQFGALVAANAGLQGHTVVKGNDSTWGFDVGLLFNFNDRTRVGLSYRSATKFGVEGNATFAVPTSGNATGQAVISGARASVLADGPVTLDIELPASARLAVAQKAGNAIELLGEVSWTQWSAIEELRVKRINGVTLSNTPENFKDTLRYSLGANFQVSDGLKLRIGAAKDESPVRDAYRTPRLPDADRTWLSVGAKVNVTDHLALDVGYANVKADNAPLNQNDGSTSGNGLLLGTHKTNINIYGAQATVSF